MRSVFCVSIVLGLLTTRPVSGEDFQVRLGLVHGHLRETFFGCADGATDGYDRGKDDMAPPPGIETGYTAFISPDGRFYLYRDVRAPADSITWKFFARVYADKTIQVSWDPKELPAAFDFEMEAGKKALDMRKTTEVSVRDTKVLAITATRKGKVKAAPARPLPPAPAVKEGETGAKPKPRKDK